MVHLSYITLLLLIILLPIVAKQNASHKVMFKATHKSTSSFWLRKVEDPRKQGCWNRPWICRQREFGSKIVCCGDRCVDVTSDDSNCGRCGFKCKFGNKCCGGSCFDLSNDPFHCGKCFNKCDFGIFCSFGMCGYAKPPPYTFPPFPPKPPHTYPPRPICPPSYTPPSPYYSPPSHSPSYGDPPTIPSYSPPPIYSPPSPPYSPPPTRSTVLDL